MMSWALTGNIDKTYVFEYHYDIKGAVLHEQTKLAAWLKECGVEDAIHWIGRYIRPTRSRNPETGYAGKGRVCFRLILIFLSDADATHFKLAYLDA